MAIFSPLLRRAKTRAGAHARVVQNQQVTRFQNLRQITHVAVLGSFLGDGIPQEACPIPGIHRLLGNRVGGQVNVVVA